ncbi:leucine--tRNA ligase [Deinococcus maricopensis]|uniref:Leucine--tRNA ligase n=1 Tax=Deinococcus maricopensis (strain DSM 21211 / LMG 22137 / NRRL B-23946 / LB-34) TaxID=709986 RepID=E8U8Q5_DEIML|nr:leucine--tRNA ligase [Deinococcus maricopensis]ADV67444.1 leucyl-tRNA synthetase [Deinococcus maricopensis DSM 21211]
MTINIQEPRSERYNPHAIEQKWQTAWDEAGLYAFHEDPRKQKHYALTMFPYPSGNLHIGHWYAYVVPDARARWMRMRGYNVLFPMGFDAFGLPAENAAIKRGINPRTWTLDNIQYMTGQFRRMGTMIDWSRQFATCQPEYYRWNQWFFTRMFERGLAYKKESFVNWDPVDQTVLANEQVVDGRGERSGALVERRLMSQWHFKITEYAEELLDFSGTDMPERVRLMQQNWIGKSVGAEVDFATDAGIVTVFTTRPDTLYGATFLVLAPEHPLVDPLTTDEQREAVGAYKEAAGRLSEIDRQAEGREKTGVFTGAYATHPITGERIPVWIADYVLVTYGSGAIMAVPSGDQRDFEFARKYGLPIVEVVRPEGAEALDMDAATEAYTGDGVIVNSGDLNGMRGGKAFIGPVIERLAGYGVRAKTTYRLRDWLVSRQRYWGTPIPITYCDTCGAQPVPDDQLPIELPDDVEFLPTGQSPLKLHPTWSKTTCAKCGGPAERDTDTMDTFVDSSWYMYRFTSPHFDQAPWDKDAAERLTPIDLYTGGIEHAILHLLYSRFWTKVARDLGLTSNSEPFRALRNQGIILGEDQEKMSKSRGNVIDPDDLVQEYGADTVRTYLMFIAPWEVGGPWSASGINGPSKWLSRVWSLYFDENASGPAENTTEAELRYATHTTLQKVTGDFERLSFNTIVAALMEYTNALVKAKRSPAFGTDAWAEALRIFNLMLAPIVPHIAEELWRESGHAQSVHLEAWPSVDETATVRDTVTMAVQVNGKVRGQVEISKTATQADAMAAARANPDVAKFVDGKDTVKEIFVPGRIINIVVKG